MVVPPFWVDGFTGCSLLLLLFLCIWVLMEEVSFFFSSKLFLKTIAKRSLFIEKFVREYILVFNGVLFLLFVYIIGF